MQIIRNIEFHAGSKEEKLPGFDSAFPYIASRAELDCYRNFFCPWHWHKAVELFYMKSGELRYCTPRSTAVFPAGSGGMINSNVLHMTEVLSRTERNIQLLHIFDPILIAGSCGSTIGQKYVTPLTAAPKPEMIALSPDNPEHADILTLIRSAFQLDEDGFGYEIKLRGLLSEIWLKLLELSAPILQDADASDTRAEDKIKTMMIYIHEHFSEKITVSDLADAAYLSERECYRVFRSCLHMTPSEYMTSYRLQNACRMLTEGHESVTGIGQACGLGSSSYFGKTFRTHIGCTPLEYRRKWQNSDKN